jgi:hypothetical protein
MAHPELRTEVQGQGDATPESYLVFLSLIEAGYFSLDAEGRLWRHAFQLQGGTWKPCVRRRADRPHSSNGGRVVGVTRDKKRYNVSVHNLIWLYHGGRLREGFKVSHKNGVRDDNRLVNLCEISRSEAALRASDSRRRVRLQKRRPRPHAMDDHYQTFLSYVAAGYFSVDAKGRVWRHALQHRTGVWRPCRSRLLGHRHEKGYRFISILLGGERVPLQVSRIVWLARRGPIPEGHRVSHRNGIRSDNRPDNLHLIL